jgi:hypothetical protein
MTVMTAEQALEAGKNLDFTQVWTALMETRARMEEMFAKTDAEMREMFAKSDAQIEKMSRRVDNVAETLGKFGNSQGSLLEEMFSANVWDKFGAFGYDFTLGRQMRFKDRNIVLAEVDIFLENGAYAMAVEVKTKLTEYWVGEHLERLGKIREYMDQHGDKRKLVGAVAGGVVPENVRRYAERNGLYVLIQNGENISIAEEPGKFHAKEW